MDNNLSNVSYVVAACVVLHNFCEMQGDGYLAEWGLQETVRFPLLQLPLKVATALMQDAFGML
jgi:hypothetical protein